MSSGMCWIFGYQFLVVAKPDGSNAVDAQARAQPEVRVLGGLQLNVRALPC